MLELWRRIRENKDLSAINTLINIAKLLLAAAIVAIPFVGALVFPAWAPGAIGGGLATISILFLVWMITSFIQRRNDQKGAPNPHIQVLERRQTVTVHSMDDIEYKYSLKVKYTKSGVTSYISRFNWTGEGEITASIQNRGFSCQLDSLSDVVSHIMRINFDSPRKRGVEESLVFTTRARGTKLTQRPFYSQSVPRRAPKLLELRVEFGKDLPIQGVHKEIYVMGAAFPIAPPEPVVMGSDRVIQWTIPAKRGHRYCISWEYAPNSSS